MNDFSPNLSSGFMNAYDPNSMIPRLDVLRNILIKHITRTRFCIKQLSEYLYTFSLSSGSEKKTDALPEATIKYLHKLYKERKKTDLSKIFVLTCIQSDIFNSKEFDEQFFKRII